MSNVCAWDIYIYIFFLAHPNHNNNNKTAQLVPISTACYIKFGITAILSLVLFFFYRHNIFPGT